MKNLPPDKAEALGCYLPLHVNRGPKQCVILPIPRFDSLALYKLHKIRSYDFDDSKGTQKLLLAYVCCTRDNLSECLHYSPFSQIQCLPKASFAQNLYLPFQQVR